MNAAAWFNSQSFHSNIGPSPAPRHDIVIAYDANGRELGRFDLWATDAPERLAALLESAHNAALFSREAA